MTTEEWESAFPIPYGPAYKSSFGLTKREYFAVHIMAGLCASSDAIGDDQFIATGAVNLADALIAALNAPVTP